MLKSVKPFAKHLQGKKCLLACIFCLGLASSAASLATPLIGKSFIDAVTQRGDYSIVPRIAAALLGLAVVDLILGTLTQVVHTKLSATVLVEIRQRIFAHCLNAPLEALERFRHGDLLSRFGTDVPKIQTLLVDGVLGFIQSLIFLIVAATILFNLSSDLALWSFLGIALALGATTAFRQPIESGTRGIREVMAGLSHFLSERLGALRAVRLHAGQQDEQQTFGRHNAELVRKLLRFQLLDASATGLPGIMLSASLAWIYLLGGGILEMGEISLVTFVAFILYPGRLYGPARGVL
jgi:ABC-type multidrug transport system fused ATPase/permease subunit